jgi:peptidoglycan/xylan/chitin deacetylase (PgdA/CDA1 family)
MITLHVWLSRTAVLLALACARAPAVVSAPAATTKPTTKVAVTFDDLPWIGKVAPGDSKLAATGRLLSALRRRAVPAIGFVNCARIEASDDLLSAWRRAGFELGNHGHSHLDLSKVNVEVWLDDARRCHEILANQLQPDRPPRFFRYPFLHQGVTVADRQRAADGLAQLGYRIAHVTIDNLDYAIAAAYGRAAAAGDQGEQRRLAQLYRAHLLAAFDHFDAVARAGLGRSVAHVLLVHANLLAADHFGEIVDALAARGVAFVSLEEALADPVYLQQDRYVGPKGISWLYRARPELLAKWAAHDNAVEAQVETDLQPR